MKSAVSVLLMLCMAFTIKAQDLQTSIQKTILPYTIQVGYDQTVNLIFPYSIKSVDRGNSEVLVQKAKEVENVLQVKAAVDDFTPTNLTVITGEGSLYSFLLEYSPNPERLNHKVAELTKPIEQSILLTEGGNEGAVRNTAKRILAKRKFLEKPKDHRFKTGITLYGIYIHRNVLYFQLHLHNKSNIPYDVDQFRIYIKDKKIGKRTASQELDITPEFIEGNNHRIDGDSGQTVVMAVPKFTIPNKKLLYMELLEQSGGRNLKIRISNKQLIKARGI